MGSQSTKQSKPQQKLPPTNYGTSGDSPSVPNNSPTSQTIKKSTNAGYLNPESGEKETTRSHLRRGIDLKNTSRTGGRYPSEKHDMSSRRNQNSSKDSTNISTSQNTTKRAGQRAEEKDLQRIEMLEMHMQEIESANLIIRIDCLEKALMEALPPPSASGMVGTSSSGADRLDILESRVNSLDFNILSARLSRLEEIIAQISASQHLSSMAPSSPLRVLTIGIVFSERFPSIPSSAMLFQQFQDAITSRLQGFQMVRCSSYQEAVSNTDVVLYVCFTTGVRYHHDLPSTLLTDMQTKKVYLLSLFTGCMEKSSATWSGDLTQFVYDFFVDEQKGVTFATTDVHEVARLSENITVFASLCSNIIRS